MSRTLRGPVLALLALVLALSTPLTADASQTSKASSRTEAKRPTFTRAEAKDVLSEAKSVLRSDADGPTARDASGDLTMKLRDLYLARPYLTGADRRTADRLLSRDTAAANVASAAPTNARAAALTVKCSAHFCVHHSSSATTAWAQTTLDTLEHVWSVEVPFMGGRTPLADGGTSSDPNNPNDKLDVFLQNLAPQGLYGGCTGDDAASGNQVSAYCVLDDNYRESEYGAPPLESLKVTAAHEFFHTIQFAMDITEDLWFMEGTAAWMEDYVYDSINDNYQYLETSPIQHPRTSLDSEADTFPYGAFIFFTYASERNAPSIVRQFWDGAIGSPTSYQSVYNVVGASAWPTFWATFGSWNTLPAGTYSERSGYPRPVFGYTKTLSTKSPSTGWRTVGIPRLATSTVLLRPDAKLSTSKHIMIALNGATVAAGTAALLQRRYVDGRVTHKMIKLDANGDGHTLVSFNRKVLRAVVVVLSNNKRSGGKHDFKVRVGLR